jgi:hypothetical protein
MKVIISRTHAPIPGEWCRWQATLEDYDGGDPIGHGRTPGQAVDDLLMEIEIKIEIKGGKPQIEDSM